MKQQLYKPLGFVALGIGVIGIFLPILPTTPFVLLSAWLFARSSEKWHAWLLRSQLFGPMIRNWERDRCIGRSTKIAAALIMLSAGAGSALMLHEDPRLLVALLVFLSIGLLTVLSLKTCRCESADNS